MTDRVWKYQPFPTIGLDVYCGDVSNLVEFYDVRDGLELWHDAGTPNRIELMVLLRDTPDFNWSGFNLGGAIIHTHGHVYIGHTWGATRTDDDKWVVSVQGELYDESEDGDV